VVCVLEESVTVRLVHGCEGLGDRMAPGSDGEGCEGPGSAVPTYVARTKSPLTCRKYHGRSCVHRPPVRGGAHALCCAPFDSGSKDQASASLSAGQLDGHSILEWCGSATAGGISGVDVHSGRAAAGGGGGTWGLLVAVWPGGLHSRTNNSPELCL